MRLSSMRVLLLLLQLLLLRQMQQQEGAAAVGLSTSGQPMQLVSYRGSSKSSSSNHNSSSSSRQRALIPQTALLQANDTSLSGPIKKESAKVLRTLTFEVFENTRFVLDCGTENVRVKTATWRTGNNSCNSSSNCKPELSRICNSKFSCKILPTGEALADADSAGHAFVPCGNICPTALNPMRVLEGEYDCIEAVSVELALIGRIASGKLESYLDINWETIKEYNAAPSPGQIGAAGGVDNYMRDQIRRSSSFIVHSDFSDPAIQAAMSETGKVFTNKTVKSYMTISSSHYITNAWFTAKGSMAFLITPQQGKNPPVLINTGKNGTGMWTEADGSGLTQGVDYVCGGLDTFVYTTGLSPRNSTFKAEVHCSNKSSKGCAGLQEANDRIANDKPKSVFITGITCHPRGTAFALIFTDGTVITLGEELQGGKMTDEVTNGLSRFNALRNQRIKTIVCTTGAFAALLVNGTVFAWGDVTVGGQLPVPEPTSITDIVAADVGFAAMRGSGEVFSWGKGVVLPAKLRSGEFRAKSLWAERTCFAAFSATGALEVWGTSVSGSTFCMDGFEAEETITLASIRDQISSGITMVRFNEKAGVAVKEKPAKESTPSSWELVGWGDPEAGATIGVAAQSSIRKGVRSLHATTGAFLTVNTAGIVSSWGEHSKGGGSMPTEFIHNQPVASVTELDKSFVLISLSGEMLVTGHAGITLYSGVSKATIEGTLNPLTGGTHIVRGIGSGELFLAAIGTPCVPGDWSPWGVCSGNCVGSHTREREILYVAQHGGSCDLTLVGIEPCEGGAIGTKECGNVGSIVAGKDEEEEIPTYDSAPIPAALSMDAILGIAVCGGGIVAGIVFIIYLWNV